MADHQPGNRLNEARAANGTTPAERTGHVGMSRNIINSIKNGIFAPSTALALA
ncbi:MAG: helix-turn-helix transcriptional regulator [Rhizomicrobium sp.]